MIEIIRTEYLETIEKLKDKPFIKILIGMRRCGKSTILNQFKNILLSKYSIKSSQIIDYNFNDLDLQKLSYGELYNKIISKSTVNSSNYIFLDEIQEIKEFEKCVISLFENKKYKFDIYITGSNSHLFSSELSTLFTGRNFPINVYPLSYKEYFNFFYKLGMEHKGFEKYIKYGSLGLIIPIIDEQNLIESSLKNILYDTINKDIKSRNNIKYSNGIELVIKYIYKNIGKEISLVNIENYLKSGREPKLTSKTISKYIDWICGSILLYRVKYYDIKTKSVFKTKSKYYAGDIGVSNSLNSFNLSNNYGHLLENIIYLELLRRGYEVYTFDNRFNKNIDFLVIRNNKREYFQVTTILNDLNWNREVGNLLSINDNFNKTVLFMENTASNDIDNGIVFMNVLDWLLDK